MTYKTFRGESVEEAVNMAKFELGNNFKIVDQRKKVFRKGLFGLFGKREFFEVIVDVVDATPARKINPQNLESQKKAMDEIRQIIEARKAISETGQYAVPEFKPEKEADGVNKDVYKDILELKDALEDIVKVSRGSNRQPAKGFSHGGFDDIRSFLEKNDFEKYFIERMIENLSSSLTVKQISDKNVVRTKLEELLNQEIYIEKPILDADNGPRMVAMIGPTGVGKTTTIAKIGGNLRFSENDKKNVTFLTMDNYRIAAQEQIAKYAEIMNCPLHVIHQKDDLVNKLSDEKTDFFILDTAGRNQKRELELNEIRNYLNVVNIPLDVYLVVSATTKYNDLLEIMEKFDIIDYDRVILTKVDETNTFGSVISALSERKKKLSFICSGQKVPEEIKIAEKHDLVTRVMMKFPAYESETLVPV